MLYGVYDKMFIENRIKKKSRNEQIIEKDLLDQKEFNGLSVNWVTKKLQIVKQGENSKRSFPKEKMIT